MRLVQIRKFARPVITIGGSLTGFARGTCAFQNGLFLSEKATHLQLPISYDLLAMISQVHPVKIN